MILVLVDVPPNQTYNLCLLILNTGFQRNAQNISKMCSLLLYRVQIPYVMLSATFTYSDYPYLSLVSISSIVLSVHGTNKLDIYVPDLEYLIVSEQNVYNVSSPILSSTSQHLLIQLLRHNVQFLYVI